MQHARESIYNALQKHGCRITNARKEIISAFVRSKRPLTIAELAKRVSADEASVYRNLHVLSDLGVLEEIPLSNNVANKQKKYALTDGHHHHIVCTTCGHTEHIPCTGISKTIRHKAFARVKTHDVTYYGSCTACG